MEIEIYFNHCDLLIEYWFEDYGIEFDVVEVNGESDGAKEFERSHYRAIKPALIAALEARSERDSENLDAWRSEYEHHARNY